MVLTSVELDHFWLNSLDDLDVFGDGRCNRLSNCCLNILSGGWLEQQCLWDRVEKPWRLVLAVSAIAHFTRPPCKLASLAGGLLLGLDLELLSRFGCSLPLLLGVGVILRSNDLEDLLWCFYSGSLTPLWLILFRIFFLRLGFAGPASLLW